MMVAMIVGALLTLIPGYLLSDVLYDAGMWPLGAILRVVLFFEAIGLAFGLLFSAGAAVFFLVVGSDK
ncbi:MAG: hypothetical protein V3S94_04190 [Gammaproteobacteria bacterium]